MSYTPWVQGDAEPWATVNANFENFDAADLDAIPTSYLDTDDTLAANSDAKLATQQAVKSYVDTAIAAAGLDNFAEALATDAPNATANVVSLSAIGSASSIDVALVPKGANGSVLAAVPDGSAAGGDKRGLQAVDLQTQRNASTQVASGDYAVLSGGYRNTASGSYSAVAGGQSCVASGSYSFAAGQVCSASGNSSVALGNGTASAQSSVALGAGTADGPFSLTLGQYSKARGIRGVFAHGSGRISSFGEEFESLRVVLGMQTTNNTQTTLSVDASSVSSDNQLSLPNSSALVVRGYCVARQNSTGDTAAWGFDAVIRRGANAAATAMVAACTPTLIAADAGAAAWALAVDADTTNGCLRVRGTGETSKSIIWSCVLTAAQTVG